MQQQIPPSSPEPAAGQDATTTVLVVDDSAVERRRAGGALESTKRSAGSGRSLVEDSFPLGTIRVVYAGNGREALAKIQESPPDLVVTDLVMPEMDGLGLVKEIRAAWPGIPVVLMTAHGSEEIAAAALQAGAASYVPKRYLARDLPETVQAVLHLARANRQQQLVLEHLVEHEAKFELPNDLALVSPFVGFLQQQFKRGGLQPGEGDLHLPIALHEALINAIIHGNLEVPGYLRESEPEAYRECLTQRLVAPPYSDRRVHVVARETREELVVVIRDEGPGFDVSTLPDLTDTDDLKNATGRGLYLIRTFMDEVRFNDQGNEITLIKQRSR
jgi:CheY-like chemotaxis protein/anti-sigma regulatory factor (Ser/Thr protein kinase)